MNYDRNIKNDYKNDYSSLNRPAKRGRAGKTVGITLVLAISIGAALSFVGNEANSLPESAETTSLVLPQNSGLKAVTSEKRQSSIISLRLPGQTESSSSKKEPATQVSSIKLPKVNKTQFIQQTVEPAVTKVEKSISNSAKLESIQKKVKVSEKTPAVKSVKAPVAQTEKIKPHNNAPIELTVQKGDTLTGMFSRAGISKKELYNLLSNKKIKKQFTGLMPGQQMLVEATENAIESLSWQVNETKTLKFTRTDKGYSTDVIITELEKRIKTSSGTIKSSLFMSGVNAGLSDNLIMRMVNILGWDIDFALDMREGDQFTVVYEELFNKEGQKVRDGHILATGFTNKGREVVAVRYTNPDGHTDYYSPDGHSMRKAFLRTPVDFTRISSRFSLKRKHPILNRIRAHKGVDYAAATGTPIKASGDGKVIFRGRKGGYGRVVILQHGGKYTTLYAHMSRFNGKAKIGRYVKQGQTIGYVGMSGSATGPHLHYEFRVNGVHRNPLTVKLPKAVPLNKKFLKDFRNQSQPLIARLDIAKRTRLALK